MFIGKQTRNSELAVARLREICEREIPGKYDIEIIDLSRNPELAKDHNIVATPAVFRTLPAPVRKRIGDLSNEDRALLGLDLFTTFKAIQPKDKRTG